MTCKETLAYFEATDRMGTHLGLDRIEVAVITRIGLEHTEILGDTIAKVAAEKAGTIKSGGMYQKTGSYR